MPGLSELRQTCKKGGHEDCVTNRRQVVVAFSGGVIEDEDQGSDQHPSKSKKHHSLACTPEGEGKRKHKRQLHPHHYAEGIQRQLGDEVPTGYQAVHKCHNAQQHRFQAEGVELQPSSRQGSGARASCCRLDGQIE